MTNAGVGTATGGLLRPQFCGEETFGRDGGGDGCCFVNIEVIPATEDDLFFPETKHLAKNKIQHNPVLELTVACSFAGIIKAFVVLADTRHY